VLQVMRVWPARSQPRQPVWHQSPTSSSRAGETWPNSRFQIGRLAPSAAQQQQQCVTSHRHAQAGQEDMAQLLAPCPLPDGPPCTLSSSSSSSVNAPDPCCCIWPDYDLPVDSYALSGPIGRDKLCAMWRRAALPPAPCTWPDSQPRAFLDPFGRPCAMLCCAVLCPALCVGGCGVTCMEYLITCCCDRCAAVAVAAAAAGARWLRLFRCSRSWGCCVSAQPMPSA
jgi:hypothetical protein